MGLKPKILDRKWAGPKKQRAGTGQAVIFRPTQGFTTKAKEVAILLKKAHVHKLAFLTLVWRSQF